MGNKYSNLKQNEVFLGDFEFPVPIERVLELIKNNLGIQVRAENSINEKKQLVFPLNGVCGIYGPYTLFVDKRELKEQKITLQKLKQIINNEEYIKSASDLYKHLNLETFRK